MKFKNFIISWIFSQEKETHFYNFGNYCPQKLARNLLQVYNFSSEMPLQSSEASPLDLPSSFKENDV